jgi:hypothetical protein
MADGKQNQKYILIVGIIFGRYFCFAVTLENKCHGYKRPEHVVLM